METASKVTSFPRKRESIYLWSDVDPRFRGGDEDGDFVQLGGPKAHENRVESHVIPAQAGIHATWAPAFAGVTRMGILIQLGGPKGHENRVGSQVIPAQAGIHATWVPAFAGATRMGVFIQFGGPKGHDHSA
jgi:hypothetical protein